MDFNISKCLVSMHFLGCQLIVSSLSCANMNQASRIITSFGKQVNLLVFHDKVTRRLAANS